MKDTKSKEGNLEKCGRTQENQNIKQHKQGNKLGYKDAEWEVSK